MNGGAFTLNDRHVLAGLLAFFAAIIAINVAFAVVAVRTFPGEDVRRSYLQGLAYNDALAERRAQDALGWNAAAELRRGEAGAVLEVRLRTRDGGALNGLRLSGDLRRAATARFDEPLEFAAIGEGRYVARLGELRRGRWLLRARAADVHGGALDFESELTWAP